LGFPGLTGTQCRIVYGVDAVCFALAIAIMAWLVAAPTPNTVRRIIGMLADFGGVSLLMYALGSYGAVFVFVYLWVIIGNGLRYGPTYLYLAMALGIASYAAMVFTTPYWRHEWSVSLGIFIALIVLPLFYSLLLHRNQRLVEQLRSLASHDSLTGLANRQLFSETVARSLATARRTNAPFAVAMVDLDGFKPVNDIHGHVVGDQLLELVGKRLRNVLRKSDLVARWGGDEFVALLSVVTADGVHCVAEKIVAELSRPYPINSASITITCSVGVALYPDDGDTTEELLARADAAMYAAKRSGKDGYHAAGRRTVRERA
jgi:diguanylate cyclase (GGDEF)-like protein